ncbi:MAG: hypothetical protein Q4G05_00055 [Clostridia bacterium]|nr:hypothetical protein [Clostridia bacterium]
MRKVVRRIRKNRKILSGIDFEIEQEEDIEEDKKQYVPKYQSYDLEMKDEKVQKKVDKILISGKDEYAYLFGENEKDKWNLPLVVKNTKVINKELIERARQIGFDKADLRKIKRDINPAIAFGLKYLNDEELMKDYFLGITMKKELPFRIEHNLEKNNLDKKTFKVINKFAKKDAKIPGVVVKGAKYNIFEKLLLKFNSNKALTAGKQEEYNEKVMSQISEERKHQDGKSAIYRENLMVQQRKEKQENLLKRTKQSDKNTQEDNIVEQTDREKVSSER